MTDTTSPMDDVKRKVQRLFNHYDRDEDGWLSPAEMLQLMRDTNPGKDFTLPIVHLIIKQIKSMAGKVFGSHVDETKGWDFTGLFLTYTQVPGNDIEKDFEMLGWA